jgi:hypothetical protein
MIVVFFGCPAERASREWPSACAPDRFSNTALTPATLSCSDLEIDLERPVELVIALLVVALIVTTALLYRLAAGLQERK